MVSEKLGAAFIEVGVDTGGLTTGLAGAKAQVTGFGASVSSAFSGLAASINPATIAIAGATAGIMAVGAAFAGSVRAAAQWQTLMVDVQKVTDTTAAGFASLSKDLLAIRGETGASMESIAGAAAGAGRMGIDPTEIAGYTETILKMSSAWGMSADAASESIGKIGSVVKPAEMTWTEFGNRMGSTINDLADSMATSEESIVTGMKKVSAQMAMLKPSPDQLSAWAALIGQLQAFGMTAETSGESLKDALNYMMRDDKSGISSMLDMDATEFQEAIREDAIGTVQELAVAISELPIEEQGQALQKFGATGGQMMGMLVGKVDPVTKEIEGLNAALATGASAWENASSLNEAYAKSQETLHAQIDIFKGKISVAATSIGAVLLPYLTQMMKGVNYITQALIDLGTRGWQGLTGGLDKLDNKVGEVLSGGTETRGLVGSFVGDVTGALSDGLKSAEGQIKIGDEWMKDMADVQAARDAGKLTAQEYLSGLKEVSSAGMEGPTTGLMDSLQEFATTGKLTTDQYKKSLSSVSEIYSQVGDAAADMTGPLTEGFENGTVSAEDYISILEDMTTVSEELGDGADEALEPLTQAFEDGTVSAEEYKDIMDDVANAVTSLGSDFDSIAGPIQDAFSQGEISATQYQDAINSISDVHAQLGESTEYVIGPITEMFESGEISADEYITALDGVLSGSKEFGTEFTRQMADLNANAGNMSADEYLAAFNDIITDLGVDIEKELKDVDAGSAGEKVGKDFGESFTDTVSKMMKEKSMSREIASMYALGATSNLGALDLYNQYFSSDEPREAGAAGYESGGVQYTYQWDRTSKNPTLTLYANGKQIKKLASVDYSGLMAGIDTPWSMMESLGISAPKEDSPEYLDMRAAYLESVGETTEAIALRGEAETIRIKTKIDPYEVWGSPQHMADMYAGYIDQGIGEPLFKSIYNITRNLEEEGKAGMMRAWETILDPNATESQVSAALSLLESSGVFGGWGRDVALQVRDGFAETDLELVDSIVDAGKYQEYKLEELGATWGNALKDSMINVQEQETLLGIVDALEDAGYEGSAALRQAILDEDWEEVGRIVGEITGDGVVEGFGGIGERLSEEFMRATSALKSNEIFKMLWYGSPEEQAQAETWIRENVANQDVWFRKHLGDAASGWMKDAEEYGLRVDSSFWTTLETAWETHSEWFDDESRMFLEGVERRFGSIGGMINAPFETQIKLLDVLANGYKKVDDALAKYTAEADCACEAMSSFGMAQEKMSDQLFNRSYIGPTSGYAAFLEEERARGAFHPEAQQLSIVYKVEADTEAAEKSVEDLKNDIDQSEAAPRIDAMTQPAYDAVDSFLGWVSGISASVYVGAYGPGTEYMGGGDTGYLESLSPGITSSPDWGTSSWLPVLDSGGIVTGPTIASLAQDNRPEAIIPLDQITKIIGGGGPTYNISVNGGGNAEEIARAIRGAIEDYDREKNRSGAYA